MSRVDIYLLPEDIVKIIVGLLDPHMVTLLDKKYRDGYFTKYGICIQEISISKDKIESPLLQKYKINRYMYGNTDYFESEILYKNTVSINKSFIYDLGCYIDKFTNLVYVSGDLVINSRNLEKLRLIKNDLVLIADSETRLELIKKYNNLPNLISVSFSQKMYGCNLDGLESRIIKAPSFLLKENTEYPNMEVVEINHILDYLRKNIRLPRLKKVLVYPPLLPDQSANVKKMYPGVIIRGL